MVWRSSQTDESRKRVCLTLLRRSAPRYDSFSGSLRAKRSNLGVLDRVSAAWFTPLASNGRIDLEVPGRTVGDFDLCSVELGYDKSIEAFIVGLAVVGHQADRCRFADPKPASAVGAESARLPRRRRERYWPRSSSISPPRVSASPRQGSSCVPSGVPPQDRQ